jgi:hypothetical protein
MNDMVAQWTQSDKESSRLAGIIELLEVLQVLPNEVNEVKVIMSRLEHSNELCYAILKEQGWLLKEQQQRLNKLETGVSV